jgi:hypothetical protein
MSPSCKFEVKMTKKFFLTPKINLREVYMEYDRMVVFIRHDSAKIWGFRYELTLVIGTLKNMASTGIFVLVTCNLKHSISGNGRQPGINWTQTKHE